MYVFTFCLKMSYIRSQITCIFHTMYAECGLFIFPLHPIIPCAVEIAKRLILHTMYCQCTDKDQRHIFAEPTDAKRCRSLEMVGFLVLKTKSHFMLGELIFLYHNSIQQSLKNYKIKWYFCCYSHYVPFSNIPLRCMLHFQNSAKHVLRLCFSFML